MSKLGYQLGRKFWNWLKVMLIVSLVTGCGAAQFANGIGGTGITMGHITGFGSMYVNGIKFNTDDALFTRDGVSSKQQSDFSTGEIVKIIGTVDQDNKTGIATEVIFSDVLEGPVTAILDAADIQIEVLGQVVTITELTVLHGFKDLEELELDNMLEVSGFIDTEGKITASSIKLLEEEFNFSSILDIEGNVSLLDANNRTFQLNDNLTIDYSNAVFEGFSEADLQNTQYLAVFSEQNIQNGRIIAHTLFAVDNTLEVGASYEIEGLVTRFVSTTDFDIEGLAVSINSDTVYKNGSSQDIKLNQRAIVTGIADANSIVAEQITLFDSSKEVSLEASIEAIDLTQGTIRILGETVLIDSFTLFSDDRSSNDSSNLSDSFLSLNLEQFSLGDFVFINAYQNQQGKVVATRLSKTDLFESLYLSAQLESFQADLGIVMLFGQTVTRYTDTFYFDIESNFITQTEFFSLLQNNPKAIIDVTGTITGNKAILADTLGILEVE